MKIEVYTTSLGATRIPIAPELLKTFELDEFQLTDLEADIEELDTLDLEFFDIWVSLKLIRIYYV